MQVLTLGGFPADWANTTGRVYYYLRENSRRRDRSGGSRCCA